MDEAQKLKIIEDNPIGEALDVFREEIFAVTCRDASVPCNLGALDQLKQGDLQSLALALLSTLLNARASHLLLSSSGDKPLRKELSSAYSAVRSKDFDLVNIKSLLRTAITRASEDISIWDEAERVIAATKFTPPPPTRFPFFQQIPSKHSTSSLVNSSELRKDVDQLLKVELRAFYVGIPAFYKTFFGEVVNLDSASQAIFQKCSEGSDPLFRDGWRGWPADAQQDGVLKWFTQVTEEISKLAEVDWPVPAHRRRPLACPNMPIQGSVGERKLDVGFVDDSTKKDSRYQWSQILVPGELKSNPSADSAAQAWADLGRYAREVLAAQDARRFVLGFTLCGSLMRIWEFDRTGRIASEKFDIHKDGLQFVYSILGFLWMSEEQLGFDPTIRTEDGKRFFEIEKDGLKERIIIDALILRTRCIVGRATTCWKAHPDGHPDLQLVVKDSWQYPEREEEGGLLREAASRGVVNVARHYHHETVQIRGEVDDTRSNVRGGLDVTTATNYRSERSTVPPRLAGKSTSPAGPMAPPSKSPGGTLAEADSSSVTAKKRPASPLDAALHERKRTRLTVPAQTNNDTPQNRVHRRVILCDIGVPLYKASSRLALLDALISCLEGHKSLREKAGILHRDISINNMLIKKEGDDTSWPGFLIDLDHSIREDRLAASGAVNKTGTRAFMAIGALQGERHNFMHDLESFFWVLFWLCIHYDAAGKPIRREAFDAWNYEGDQSLITIKIGTVFDQEYFLRIIKENFTSHYQPMIPWVDKLRGVVFLNGKKRTTLAPQLYSQMRDVLREAQKDPSVIGC